MKHADKERLIACTNHLLALAKPSGLVTQGDKGLEGWGKEWLRHKFHKPGNVFLEAVHRLDRPVSGVVLFARTSKALSRLQAFQRAGRMKKTYVALVQGHMRETVGVWEDCLIHGAHRALIDPNGRPSFLEFQVLKILGANTLVELRLITGRYHQIRIQFASRGFPIIGDSRYGSGVLFAPDGAIALHHFALEIPDPISELPLRFTAPCPFANC